MGSWRTFARSLYPGWRADVSSGLISGILASVIILAGLSWKAEWVAEQTLAANPTCSSPRGLREAQVVGATAGSEHTPNYTAGNAIDDAGHSMWIPRILPKTDEDDYSPRFDMDDDANVLALHLKDEADIRLVCVVNGSVHWFTSYQNWGRVRSVEVWGREADNRRLGILQSLGADDFPNAQLAARNLGETDVVHLALIGSYTGQRVETFNAAACLDGAVVEEIDGQQRNALPDFQDAQDIDFADGINLRYEPGCILEPKVKAGLAEVYVYTDD
jgi:hypothetical protein